MLVGVNGGLLDGFTELLEYCLTQVFRRLLHVFLPLLSVITVCTCMMYLKFNGEHVVRKTVVKRLFGPSQSIGWWTNHDLVAHVFCFSRSASIGLRSMSFVGDVFSVLPYFKHES